MHTPFLKPTKVMCIVLQWPAMVSSLLTMIVRNLIAHL
jgi:hypothetical protein